MIDEAPPIRTQDFTRPPPEAVQALLRRDPKSEF